MSKSIKGTQTEKNLLTSFAGESQARMRYTYFASVAKKEGYEQISAIFTETADQEKEHAKRMFKFLEGGMVEITASYPAGVIGTTLENLQAAAAGEHEEWSLDYPHFADVAEQEGFPEIAAMYRNISIAEKGHEERYRAFIQNIETASVFAKEGEVVWQCRNCGFIYTGKEAGADYTKAYGIFCPLYSYNPRLFHIFSATCIPVHSATGFRPLFICNIISLVLRKALHRLWKHLESEAVFPNWQPVLSYDYIV